MAYDSELADFVRQRLADRPDLVERRMMGGICFMLGGHMCCGVRGTSLMVRVGPQAYPGALAEAHIRPLEFGGRRPKGFVLVDREGWSSEAGFAVWVQRGVDFVATLPPEKAARARG